MAQGNELQPVAEPSGYHHQSGYGLRHAGPDHPSGNKSRIVGTLNFF
jgi:hypothetical protein